MKKISLRARITIMTGLVLLICSIALTVTASFNARIQFPDTLFEDVQELEPIPFIEGQEPMTTEAPTGAYQGAYTGDQPVALTEARQQFNMAGIIALFVISTIGMVAVYVATGKSLQPVHALSEEIAAITEHNLHTQVSDDGRKDEIGSLRRSFNAMLERLENSFTTQKRFSANVAHELKTPLATMNASIQVLALDDEPTFDDYQKLMATIERNTQRMRTIVDDLMKLTDEENSFETELVDLYTLFSAIELELADQISDKHLVIEKGLELYTVHGKQSLLYQAFFNLFENAVKYNKQQGVIQIKTWQNGHVGYISISDTGIGISADEMEHIFEPFYRISKSRSRKTGGSGLGLSVVKTILERHGFNIALESEVGEGSTFTVQMFLE